MSDNHIEYEMLIFTDAKENNNKFYELILNSDNTVVTRWGRVGVEGKSKTCPGGKDEFDKILRGKLSKGYEKAKTIHLNSSPSQNKAALAQAARRDMLSHIEDVKSSNVLSNLVDKLTEMNRHQLVVASNGNINITDEGIITTPLGMVTLSTIEEARNLLLKIENNVLKKSFISNSYIENLERYLKLIPQKVPTRRGWYEKFFTEFSSLQNQNSLLDQLEESIDLYKTKINNDLKIDEKLFSTKLEIVTNQKIIDKIEKFFNQNKNIQHVSSQLKLKNIFELDNKNLKDRFDARCKSLRNIQTLWHGTRAFNVLSILKGGLIIPKSGGSYHITGRMYGNGIYFSDQSTKALNYSYGYWDRDSKDNNCFMFVADVAMGKQYYPEKIKRSYPVDGYDSIFAKAGQSGVINNEMIVYDIEQVNLRYLCEFSSA